MQGEIGNCEFAILTLNEKIQYACQEMVKASIPGSIVNISSTRGNKQVGSLSSVYDATKVGVESVTRSVAEEMRWPNMESDATLLDRDSFKLHLASNSPAHLNV